MAEKQYAYYLEGSRIAIVEKATNFSNNVDNKEFGPGVAKQEWKSPQSSVTSGIELKYTNAPGDDIEDETSIIDLPSYLCKGLVYYIKARLAEDEGNIQLKEYFLKEFRRILEKNESSKIKGIRVMSTGGHAIR
tara:strand:+ start:3598 stop:3999 length:402 start_codon:yes stop_codon:yes gene_type:complete